MKKLIIPLFLLGIFFAGCSTKPEITLQACTEEAKVCPNGSTVGRTGPNCEFAPCGWDQTGCIHTCDCPEGYRQEGQLCNPKCYYSTPKCSMPSVQCQEVTACRQGK